MLNKDDKIKNYILEKYLGEGSFGEVWLAKKQIELSDEGILVALKFLKYKPSKDETQEKFIEKVRREVATWIKASGHKNIVSVQDGFQFQTDTFVIVSDFADGGDLGNWLKSHGGKSPDLRKTVEIFCEILEGLQHLHTQTPEKIIHRDLKPDNILFKNGQPCITDFGVSRMSNTVSNSMIKGSSAGTPLYMSPEVLNNKPASRSMDVWSMGVMLYEMLSGNYPYFPTEGNIYSLILDIIQNPYQPLPTDVPFEFQKIVAKALEKDVNKRYQSAEEMRFTLKNALKVWERSLEQRKTIDDEVYQRQQKIKTAVLPKPIQNEPLPTEGWREIERQEREIEEKRLKKRQIEEIKLREIEIKQLESENKLRLELQNQSDNSAIKRRYQRLLRRAEEVGFKLNEKPVLSKDWLNGFENKIQNHLIENKRQQQIVPSKSHNVLKWIIGGISALLLGLFGYFSSNLLLINEPVNTSNTNTNVIQPINPESLNYSDKFLFGFETNRRIVDSNPAEYITTNSQNADSADDFYLLGRANFFLADYPKAKENFKKSKDLLSFLSETNLKTIEREIDIFNAVMADTDATKAFEKEKMLLLDSKFKRQSNSNFETFELARRMVDKNPIEFIKDNKNNKSRTQGISKIEEDYLIARANFFVADYPKSLEHLALVKNLLLKSTEIDPTMARDIVMLLAIMSDTDAIKFFEKEKMSKRKL